MGRVEENGECEAGALLMRGMIFSAIGKFIISSFLLLMGIGPQISRN